MTEFQATGAPGVYYYAWTPPSGDDDVYVGYVRDSSATAKNVPQTCEVYVGGWADQINDMDTRLPSDPADESLQQAAHAATQADIAALNDLDQAGVQAALTAQGYTAARAPNLDNLDAAVSTRATPAQVKTQADQALVDYDPPTAAELNTVEDNIRGADNRDLSELAGAGFNAATDTLEEIRDAVDGIAVSGDWTTAEKNQIRFRLAMDGPQTDPTTGTGTLEDILADTDAIDSRLPSDPADESLQQAAHAATQADIAALNDLSQANVQAAMSAQGYTAARAPNLDNLDAPISGRAVPGDAMTLTAGERSAIEAALAAIHGGGSWETAVATVDWTPAEKDAIREALGVPGAKAGAAGGHLQDVLTDTAAIDGRLPVDPSDESNQNANHNATQLLIAALNDLDQAGVQAALTAQGYTAGRAAALDNLDDAVTSRAAPGDAMALVPNAVDSTALAASAATEIANEVESVQAGVHGGGSWETAAPATGDWTSGEREQIRDALGVAGAKTAATGGQLQEVKTAAEAVDTRLPADPADESLQQASHAQTQADIAALEDLSPAQVAAVFNSQGYTTIRAAGLDDTKAAAEAVDARLPADPADESNQLAAHAQTQADIAALENLSSAQAEAACDAALTSYDGPTKAELDTVESNLAAGHATTQAAIAGLEDLAATDIFVVKQTYAYDSGGDVLVGLIWVEDGSGAIVTPTSVSVDLKDADDTLLFNLTDASPDASGFFKVEQAAPGFATGQAIKAVADVVVPVVGTLSSGYGMFSIG